MKQSNDFQHTKFFHHLKNKLLEKWREIPQDLNNTLVNSMKSKCEIYVAVPSDHASFKKKSKRDELNFPSFSGFFKCCFNFHILRIINCQKL